MMKVLSQGILILIALLFLYSGVSKLLNPVDFARSIQHYQIIGHPLTLVAALLVPWIECVAAGAILFRCWRSAASLLLIGLLLAFEIILASAYLRGLDIDCGCFGSGPEQSVIFAFFRNLGLIAMLLFVLIANRKDNEAS